MTTIRLSRRAVSASAMAFAIGLLGVTSAGAHTHAYQVGPLSISHPYARATVAGQQAGGAYLSVKNTGVADRLVSASTEVAAGVELHTMRMEGDVMRMRQLDAIDVPAGGTIDLKPGGLHLMLMGLKRPLAAGSQFPLTLKFERAGEVRVQVEVQAAGVPTGKPADGGHSHGHKH